MSKQIQSYQSIVARVRELQSKRASAVPEKDPTCQGEVSVPDAHGNRPGPQNLPPNRHQIQNGTVNVPGSHIEGAGPTGTAVPETASGVDLDKIARSVPAITQRIAALYGGAQETSFPVKYAAEATGEFSADMLTKLGAAMLETEEGRQLAEGVLLKSAGAEAARSLMGAAAQQYDGLVAQSMQEQAVVEELNKHAAYQQALQQGAAEAAAVGNFVQAEEFQKAAAAHQFALHEQAMTDPAYAEAFYKQAAEESAQQEIALTEEILKHASADELSQIADLSLTLPAVEATIDNDWEKAAFQQGVQDGAEIEASIEPEVPGGPEGAPNLEGADEHPSIEQIAQVLQEAVQSGEIPPEVAQQVMQELLGALEGDEHEGGIDPQQLAAMQAQGGIDPLQTAKEASYLANVLVPELNY